MRKETFTQLIGIGNKPSITYVIQEYVFNDDFIIGATLTIKGDSEFENDFDSIGEAVEAVSKFVKKYHSDQHVLLEFKPTELVKVKAKLKL